MFRISEPPMCINSSTGSRLYRLSCQKFLSFQASSQIVIARLFAFEYKQVPAFRGSEVPLLIEDIVKGQQRLATE